MKKLILLGLIISFGLTPTAPAQTVLEILDFYGYDFKGNYIEKIQRVEDVYPNTDWKMIYWMSTGGEKLNNRDTEISDLPRTSPYTDDPYSGSVSNSINFKDEYLCSYAQNYKYFTTYIFYDIKDPYIDVDYGMRLLKPPPESSLQWYWNTINMLYYKKSVSISEKKTVIRNQYVVAVKEDSLNKKYAWLQLDPANYYLTRNNKTNPNSLKKGKALKEQVKKSIWINIDDDINNTYDGEDLCFDEIPQSVYDKNHIITLNDDFEYAQNIESRISQINPELIIDEDHTYVFTFGLEDPSKDIDDLDVDNAIEYRITFISDNTKLKYYSDKTLPGYFYWEKRKSGSYKLQIKKKIKGVFYFDETIYSEEAWDFYEESERRKIYLYSQSYDAKGEGLIKFFRSSDNIYFVLNNNLLDTTKNHYFENNTLLINSYFENIFDTRTNFRPFFNQFGFEYLDKAHIMISKTINKKIPLNKEIFKSSSNNWSGNGSGIIISKLGHIVTNHHVIKEAKEVEVEFILNNEIKKFNAEVIQVDKTNDLAILKIVDESFQGVANIPYNFKARSSDVGTKIYTFGYPKALSGMGKEIKVTEGIISSKSGIMGDITTYQITAPIQGGNSGGPLFDDKGNFIGINSSKFNSDETENVNYSIKSSYVMSLIDVLPKSIDLPSSTKLQSLPLTEQIKEISKYVVLVKVK